MDDASSACVAHVNSIEEKEEGKKKSFDSTRTKTRNRSKKNNNNGNERKWPNAIDKPNVHTHKRNLKKKNRHTP